MATPEEMRAQIRVLRLQLVEERREHNDTLRRLIRQNENAAMLGRRIQRLRKKNKKLRRKNRQLERGMNILRRTQEWLGGALARICESIREAFEAFPIVPLADDMV